MKDYRLLKSNKYIIYGAAFMGKLMLNGMNKAGYTVTAFLDRRAEKLKEVDGVKVYAPETYEDEDREHTIVLVAITNVFEQPQVAAYLKKLGYNRIICKMSANNQYKSENVKKMFVAYEMILEGTVCEEVELSELSEDCQDIFFEEHALIKNVNENEVIAYIPVELCHTGTVYMPDEFWGKNEECEEEGTLIIYSQTRIIELFKAFEGKADSVKEAMEKFRDYFFKNPGRYYSFPRTEQGFDDFVSNRYEVYMRMSQMLNQGMDFFIQVPIVVKWNEGGYFNLSDGVHRVCFFVAKGLRYIPAKMSREDFECWKNEKKLYDCIEYMKKMDCLPAYAPILHPNFMNYPTRRDTAGDTRIIQIFNYLYNKKMSMSEKSFLDIGSYYSFFSQAFERLGADVTTLEVYESSYEAGKKINDLLHCHNITAIHGDILNTDFERKFDITMMLTVFYPYLDTEDGKKIIKKVSNITRNMLIWESGEKPKMEIEYILRHTDFSGYEKIAETYGTGRTRELGVFYKE